MANGSLLRDEIDILYSMSNKLTQASTPVEWLEAVSDYARDGGAASGVLFYVHPGPMHEPATLEIAAQWARGAPRNWPEGARFEIEPHRAFMRQWLTAPDRPMVIADVYASDVLDATTRAFYEQAGMRSSVVLPLYHGGHWIGLLIFSWREPADFDERDLRIFTAILRQAGPIIASVRLGDQNRERVRRAERLLRVNTALSQAANEAQIVGAVTLYADQHPPDLIMLSYILADATGQPAQVVNVARWQDGAIHDDHLRMGRAISMSDFALAALWAAQPEETILLEDSLSDERLDPASRDLLRQYELRGLAILPLHSFGRWQGLLSVGWNVPHTFTEEEVYVYTGLRQTLASVVTSRRAYLAQMDAHLEAAQRALELETVAKVSAAAASILDLERLLNTLTELARAAFPSYYIDIYLLDAETGAFAPAPGPGREPLHRIAASDPRALVARAARLRQGVMVNDASIAPEGVLSPGAPGARSEMAVPMITAEQVAGVLVAQSAEPERFSQGDIRVMSTLADLMAVAIENARLYRAAQELAVFEERSRLARELHDSVSQALYGIALGTRTAQKLLERDPSRLREPLDYVLALAEAGLSEMRALIFELRPELLENDGLKAALAAQVASLQARHQIEVDAALCDEPELPIALKEALYRIAREALHNTVKHARASQVRVHMTCLPDGIVLELADNGVGFDPSASFPGHLGLKSMRERAQLAGASFTLHSAPGEGTRIVVEVRARA